MTVLSPCAQVHAELVFEVAEAVKPLRLNVVELMSGVGCACDTVDVGVGLNWDEAH